MQPEDEQRALQQYWNGRFAEAAAFWRARIEAGAKAPSDSLNLAVCLQAMDAPAAASEVLERAIDRFGASAALLNNLGNARLAAGAVPAAMDCWRRALALDPTHANAARMVEGDVLPQIRLDRPGWDGAPCPGRTLLVYANQGIGDAIDLARHLGAARKRAGRLVFACHGPLVRLFAASDVADEVVNRDAPSPACDAVTPMSALPYLLHGDGPHPAISPVHLAFDPQTAASKRALLAHRPGLRVGLVWAGNPRHPGDAERSLAFADLAPLLAVEGVVFHGLQIGAAVEQTRGNGMHGRFVSLHHEIDGFDNTAAVLAAMDLVVSVDTATAHLAGALGVELWLLLAPAPDTRWLKAPGEELPYPRVRIFRRAANEPVDAPVAKLATALASRVRETPRVETTAPSIELDAGTAAGLRDGRLRIARCRHGLMLFNPADRYIGRSLASYGEFSESEITLLRDLLRPGQVVVDVGANIGTHAVPLARSVGPTGRLLAIEPQRQAHAALRANLTLNGLAQAEALHAAAGAAQGEILVPVLPPGSDANSGGVSLGQGSTTGERVPVLTLDGLDLPAAHLIKIDVEGMELEVLRGAAGLIARHRPALYVEDDRQPRSQSLLEHLLGLDYRLYWHLPPLFNRHNLFGVADDLFPGVVSCNVLALPAETPQQVQGLREVRSAEDWPLP